MSGGTSTASIVDQITKLDLNELYNISTAIDHVIANKSLAEPTMQINTNVSRNIDFSEPREVLDFVQYSPDRFIDEDTEKLLSAEIDSMQFNKKSRSASVQNMFLSSTVDSYDWGSVKGPVLNKALNMSNFPVVQSIMDKINQQHQVQLNSVLVAYYKNGEVSARLHDDNEATMDHNQPICVLSLGAQRKVEFVSNGQPGYSAPSLSLEPVNGSLYIMKPGTQDYFRHRVRKNMRIKKDRISLSFRCFKPVNVTVSEPTDSSTEFVTPTQDVQGTPVRPVTRFCHAAKTSTSTPVVDRNVPHQGYSPYPGHKDDTVPSSNAVYSTGQKPNEKICLLFGTSITEGVIGSKMSRGSRTVVNLSSSGFGIHDVRKAAIDFWEESPDSISRVDKVIINVGTNEVKGFNSSVKKVEVFWDALCNLVQCMRYCFPKAQLIFQSILPIRLFYSYNADSVNDFNCLLIKLCSTFGCVFFDCFKLFLDSNEVDINWDLYTYSRKGVRFNQGIHLNEKGIGILCRALKYAVYHNLHSPYPSSLPFQSFYNIH